MAAGSPLQHACAELQARFQPDVPHVDPGFGKTPGARARVRPQLQVDAGAIHRHLPGEGLPDADKGADERCLTRGAGADDAKTLAGIDLLC